MDLDDEAESIDDIKKTLELFQSDDGIIEIRMLNAGKYKTISGYYDSVDKAIHDISTWDSVKEIQSVYATINPVRPALLARAANRTKNWAINTTKDSDITTRRFMLIDCDPARPAGISSTDKEKELALTTINNIGVYLAAADWSEPVKADSGNGYHLLYKIDLPNDTTSGDNISKCLAVLGGMFGSDAVHVDKTVFNAARISKIYGTMARKGDSITDRPHRRSSIISIPDTLDVTSVDKIAALAALAPEDTKTTAQDAPKTTNATTNAHKNDDKFDLFKFFTDHNIEVMREIPDGDRINYVLEECPFDRSHKSAHVTKWSNGKMGFGCFHDSCSSKKWQDFRLHFDPHAYDKKIYRDRKPEFNVIEFDKYRRTDGGNARRLVALHGECLRYCYPMDKWFVWDDSQWMMDSTGEIERRAKDTVEHIFKHATTYEDDELRKTMFKHGIQSDSKGKIGAMVDLSRSEPAIPISPDDFDADVWKFNVVNGTVDLRTLLLHPHNKHDNITKMGNVEYDASAKCPKWMQFLTRILGNDEELVTYVQKMIGSALSGHIADETFYILFGTGQNGKSTFIEIIKSIMGDYALKTSADSLMEQKNQGISNDIARLAGARFVDAAESKSTQKLDEGRIKALTGRDTITARFLYKESFDFRPQYTLLLSTNHKPYIGGTDMGIWRRVKLIPFTVTIPDDEVNKNLQDELRAEELSGIFNWALAGCKLWQADGMIDCAAVLDATDEYKDDMDTLKEFFVDCCVEEAGATVHFKVLFNVYTEWADVNHIKNPLGKINFGAKIDERKFTRVRNNKGGMVKNLRLNNSQGFTRPSIEDALYTENTNSAKFKTPDCCGKNAESEKMQQKTVTFSAQTPRGVLSDHSTPLHSISSIPSISASVNACLVDKFGVNCLLSILANGLITDSKDNTTTEIIGSVQRFALPIDLQSLEKTPDQNRHGYCGQSIHRD